MAPFMERAATVPYLQISVNFLRPGNFKLIYGGNSANSLASESRRNNPQQLQHIDYHLDTAQ
jgi:hypothetical protein